MSEPRSRVPRARVHAGHDLASVMSEALTDQQRSLVWLRDRLQARGVAVSLSALSYWRSGQRRPERDESMLAITAIEGLLNLPPGALLDAAGPSRRPGPAEPTASFADLLPPAISAAVMAALDELDLIDMQTWYVEETNCLTVDVDAHGQQVHCRTRTRIRATRDHVERFPLLLFAGEPIAHPLQVVELTGAYPGRRLDDLEAGFLVHELLLERPLLIGETAVIESAVDLAIVSSGPPTEFTFHLPHRVRDFEIWVRFDPAALPATCELRSAEPGAPGSAVQVDLDGLRSVHHAVSGFGPGTLGVHWTWNQEFIDRHA